MKHFIPRQFIALTISISSLLIPYEVSANAEPKTRPMGFFDLYAENRQQGIGNFITEDFWLLAYSLIRQSTLDTLEQQQMMPLFKQALIDIQQHITQDPQDTITRANHEFINLLQVLSGDSRVLSASSVEELALINAATGIHNSPLWHHPIDYSQFKPRGRYTRSKVASQYFKAMRYAGSLLFAVKASGATGISEQMASQMTAQALRLSRHVQSSKPIQTLNSLLMWQMGRSEDLSSADYLHVSQNPKQNLKDTQAALLSYAQKQQRQPKIIDGIVDSSQLAENETVQDVMTGWRFMPSRFSTDSAILQSLVYSKTGAYQSNCKKDCVVPFGYSLINGQGVKGYPSSKELMAILGSPKAKQWVINQGEDQFSGYQKAIDHAQALLPQASGLNKQQLTLLQHWLSEPKQNENQQTERLTASLAFWTWQRHINLLYAKQSYTMISKGFFMPPPRSGAKIATATAFYQALAAIVQAHQHYTPTPEWQQFSKLLAQAITLSQKTEQQQPFNKADEQFLNHLDLDLKALGGTDMPIVVDVHSNPADNQVLEQGVGYAAIVHQDKTRGARFSHYEFKQPLSNRLTDEVWKQRLSK